MIADASQQCWRGHHLAFILAVGIPGGALCIVGVPFGMIYALWRNRARLKSPKVISRLGFVYCARARRGLDCLLRFLCAFVSRSCFSIF